MSNDNELIKASELKAAPFSSEFKGLSKSQKAIFELISKHIKEQLPITVEDIKSCYYDTISKDGKLNRAYKKENYWTNGWIDYPKEDFMKSYYYSRHSSIQWFKSNLGACIIKGKILAIPIIEI